MSKSLAPEEIYNRMRDHCLGKEGAAEDHPWGEVAWKVNGKAFAFTGEGSANYTLKNTQDKQSTLTIHPQIEVAAYVVRYGWIRIEVVDEDTLELAKDLADESYDLVRKKKAGSNYHLLS